MQDPDVREEPAARITGARDQAPARGRAEEPQQPAARTTRERGSAGEDREAERGLRGLVGSGSSQVSVRAAMRARDASRPTDADMAEAQERLQIVRRNWVPREELPKSR